MVLLERARHEKALPDQNSGEMARNAVADQKSDSLMGGNPQNIS